MSNDDPRDWWGEEWQRAAQAQAAQAQVHAAEAAVRARLLSNAQPALDPSGLMNAWPAMSAPIENVSPNPWEGAALPYYAYEFPTDDDLLRRKVVNAAQRWAWLPHRSFWYVLAFEVGWIVAGLARGFMTSR